MIQIKAFEFNYFQENTFVLYDETKEAVIIDCGCIRPSEEKELSDFITANGLTIKHLLCTHLHLDHIFGNPYIYNTYGLSPVAGIQDVEIIPTLPQQAKAMGLPGNFIHIQVKKPLQGDEVITFGNSELQVLSVPGHSPGSVAFYSKEGNFAIVGDALFAGSIGRSDLWGGNQEILINSIREKLLSLPDETIIYPGHGPKTTVINEKLNNPFL